MLPATATGLPSGTRRLSEADLAGLEACTDREFRDWVSGTAVLPPPHTGADVVCHGDLFMDNLVERPDGSLAVIDWETASIDDPVFDLGMAAVGLCQSPEGTASTPPGSPCCSTATPGCDRCRTRTGPGSRTPSSSHACSWPCTATTAAEPAAPTAN
ncbi:phosphotransferase family protein [Yinghuangia aomiensis]